MVALTHKKNSFTEYTLGNIVYTSIDDYVIMLSMVYVLGQFSRMIHYAY